MNEAIPDVSVVVPLGGPKWRPPEPLLVELSRELTRLGKSHELIFVLDGGHDDWVEPLRAAVQGADVPVTVVTLARRFGAATALAVGFENARAELVLTSPAYFQVAVGELGKLFAAIGEGADVAVARRSPRGGSSLNRLQSRLYHWLVQKVTSTRFRDISCGVRLLHREAARGLDLYGDLDRFLPIVAHNRGFVVREVALRPDVRDQPQKIYGPASQVRRLLDILTVFFLTRFTYRPLRFFGMVGIVVGGIGFAITAWLGVERLLGMGGLADRPLLLLGILLLVLGVQSVSIGLLGEIIFFTHGRKTKGYRIAEVVKAEEDGP